MRGDIEGLMERLPYNKNLKPFSSQLRKTMTEAEIRLWARLKARQVGGFRFNRQKIIGNYIADFYCHEAKLVIEVDGSQHHTAEGIQADRRRDAYMESCGLRVLRFTDTDVLTNIEGVGEVILRTLGVVE